MYRIWTWKLKIICNFRMLIFIWKVFKFPQDQTCTGTGTGQFVHVMSSCSFILDRWSYFVFAESDSWRLWKTHRSTHEPNRVGHRDLIENPKETALFFGTKWQDFVEKALFTPSRVHVSTAKSVKLCKVKYHARDTTL